MNRDEAREILTLFRPNTVDAEDADFATALELMKHDAELQKWFEAHCANYKTVRAALKQVAPPLALKEQILSERNFPPIANNVVNIAQIRDRRPMFAIAAMIAVLVGIAIYWLQPYADNNYVSYRNRMVSTALRAYNMDLETNDLNQVRTFLAEKNAPANYELPDALKKSAMAGCVVLRWQNNPVSMICFRTGRSLADGEKSDLFLFVADRAAFPKRPDQNSPNFEQVNKVATANWVEGDKFYLLASRGDEKFLRKFL